MLPVCFTESIVKFINDSCPKVKKTINGPNFAFQSFPLIVVIENTNGKVQNNYNETMSKISTSLILI